MSQELQKLSHVGAGRRPGVSLVARIMLTIMLPLLWTLMSERLAAQIRNRPRVIRNAPVTKAVAPKRVARVFWQDRDTDSLKWGEVYSGSQWSLKPAPVNGFPKLDVEQQDLVQMEQAAGILLVGVRDNDGGKFQSGWIAVDTGVREEEHGNHSHWKYAAVPSVKMRQLDANQGNPAHLYLYQGAFFMANDLRNGFTYLLPRDLAAAKPNAGRFYPGGGNHITMAAVDNAVCYSTWIDGGGPNAGRVDLVNLRKVGGESLAYSFSLPSGVIHGATTNSGRVFFAPADGICWIDADPTLKQTASSVKVNHLSLGTDDETEKPLRTGAFENHRNWVLFTTGSGDSAALCLVDAKAQQPTVTKLKIPVEDGLSLVTPQAVLAAGGKRYAFIFQDRKDGEGTEYLTIVSLDPNGDRDLSDASILKTIPVGASKVDGHHGHHAVSFDSDGRLACFTNPGDGSIWVLSLLDLEIKAKLQVGGTPSAIAAIGAAEHNH